MSEVACVSNCVIGQVQLRPMTDNSDLNQNSLIRLGRHCSGLFLGTLNPTPGTDNVASCRALQKSIETTH